MKQKSYILNIGNPCSESWSEMTPVNGGRFCAHCSKTVIDFSMLTDDEIIKIISQRKDNLCGRFYTQQLNREIAPQPATHARQGFYKYAASIFLLFVSKNVFSFTNNKIDLRKENIVANPAPAKEQNFATDSLIKEIRGRVLDSATNEPIENVSVQIKGTNKGAITDILGYFTLRFPKKINYKNVILSVSHVDYVMKEIDSNETKNEIFLSPAIAELPDIVSVCDIVPRKKEIISMGVVVTVPEAIITTKHKKHWWQFWKKS